MPTGPTKPLNPAHVEWCRRFFAVLAEGATWDVPRSGLHFNKRGNELVLTDRMPHMPGMSMTAAALRTWQDEDLENHRRHFEAAGVTIRDATQGSQ